MKLVTSAIRASICEDRIVHVEYSYEVVKELLAACDDSADCGGVYEFWGTDEDGDEWRVRVRFAPWTKS